MNLDGHGSSGPRIAGLFLASTVVLVAATAALTFRLVDSAVEARLRDEITQTANLVGGGLPLGDESLRRVAGFVGAEVVAVDGAGRVVAASLPPERRRAFEQRLGEGRLPAAGERAAVREAALGEHEYVVGVAALPAPRLGAVYLLYPADLLAAQRQRVWAPVTVAAALATLFAALLGRAGERRVIAARTEALLGLLVSVAHEVKNPLGAIRAIARTQARRAREGTVAPEPLELIASESERLSLLVDGLRSVGKPVRTVRSPVDPDATTARTLELLGPQLAHRRVAVEADLRACPAGACVLADAAQLQQVVLNLVQNAADAMPRGGVVRVRAAAADAPRRWTLVVEDEGPGVPEAARARLFEPFFTTKQGGLGVGLYLSRRLARAHDGELALEPSPRGARFVLWLPLADAPTPLAAPAAAGEPAEEPVS